MLTFEILTSETCLSGTEVMAVMVGKLSTMRL